MKHIECNHNQTFYKFTSLHINYPIDVNVVNEVGGLHTI